MVPEVEARASTTPLWPTHARLRFVQALRVALAQINSTVGDLPGNCALIASWASRAAQEGAQVVLFPEMAVTGYPVEDLALRPSFARASKAKSRASSRIGRCDFALAALQTAIYLPAKTFPLCCGGGPLGPPFFMPDEV